MPRLAVDKRKVRLTAGFAWDLFMVALALFSVAVVLWFETGRLSVAAQERLILIDFAVVAIFLADWIWWLYKSEDNRTYIKRTWWDLLGMVPLYFASVGFLRFFRLLRLLRILRAFRTLKRFLERTQDMARRSKVAQLAVVAASITVVGAVLVWIVETGDPRSRVDTFAEALWWAVVTVTTVGYGDVTPVTTTGRVIAVFLMVTGIGTIGLLASQVGTALIRRDEREAGEMEAEAAPETVAGQLAALAALHDARKLTDEEFEAAKRRVIGET